MCFDANSIFGKRKTQTLAKSKGRATATSGQEKLSKGSAKIPPSKMKLSQNHVKIQSSSTQLLQRPDNFMPRSTKLSQSHLDVSSLSHGSGAYVFSSSSSDNKPSESYRYANAPESHRHGKVQQESYRCASDPPESYRYGMGERQYYGQSKLLPEKVASEPYKYTDVQSESYRHSSVPSESYRYRNVPTESPNVPPIATCMKCYESTPNYVAPSPKAMKYDSTPDYANVSPLPTMPRFPPRRVNALQSGSVRFEKADIPSSYVCSTSLSDHKCSSNKELQPSDIKVLSHWYKTHTDQPYPTPREKRALARQCGISTLQVSCWFSGLRDHLRNRRSRQH